MMLAIYVVWASQLEQTANFAKEFMLVCWTNSAKVQRGTTRTGSRDSVESTGTEKVLQNQTFMKELARSLRCCKMKKKVIAKKNNYANFCFTIDLKALKERKESVKK